MDKNRSVTVDRQAKIKRARRRASPHRRHHVSRVVKVFDVLLAVGAVLLDAVEEAGEEVHAEHGDEEQPHDLERRRAEVEHHVALHHPAPSPDIDVTPIDPSTGFWGCAGRGCLRSDADAGRAGGGRTHVTKSTAYLYLNGFLVQYLN